MQRHLHTSITDSIYPRPRRSVQVTAMHADIHFSPGGVHHFTRATRMSRNPSVVRYCNAILPNLGFSTYPPPFVDPCIFQHFGLMAGCIPRSLTTITTPQSSVQSTTTNVPKSQVAGRNNFAVAVSAKPPAALNAPLSDLRCRLTSPLDRNLQ